MTTVSPNVADEHVRRLEVAVDDALLVRVRDRVDDRDHRRQQREPLGERVASSGDRPCRATGRSTSFIA